MAKHTTAHTTTAAQPSPTPALDARLQAEPDLVDRIFEYIFSDPAMASAVQAQAQALQQHIDQLKTAVRSEFGGEAHYIQGRQGRVVARQVLALFNGRNATEAARRLGVSRATVYRHIKQAGGQPK